MNNKPVAWRIKNPQMFNEWIVFPNKEQASLYAFHNGKGNLVEPLYTHPPKTLTDEEITIVKESVGNYVCTIKMEIDQEKQTFKGYENCSNLPSLRSELKDAEQALAILRKAQ